MSVQNSEINLEQIQILLAVSLIISPIFSLISVLPEKGIAFWSLILHTLRMVFLYVETKDCDQGNFKKEISKHMFQWINITLKQLHFSLKPLKFLSNLRSNWVFLILMYVGSSNLFPESMGDKSVSRLGSKQNFSVIMIWDNPGSIQQKPIVECDLWRENISCKADFISSIRSSTSCFSTSSFMNCGYRLYCVQ